MQTHTVSVADRHITIDDLELIQNTIGVDLVARPSLKRARSVCSYWGWLKHSSSRKAVEKNDYDRIFRRAKRYVSNRERKAIALGPYAVV